MHWKLETKLDSSSLSCIHNYAFLWIHKKHVKTCTIRYATEILIDPVIWLSSTFYVMDLFSILNFDATFAGKFKPVIKKAMVELEGNNRCMPLTIVVIINWQCCIKTFNYKFHGFSWSWIFFCICLRCTFQEICIRAGGMGHQESIFQSRYIFSSLGRCLWMWLIPIKS